MRLVIGTALISGISIYAVSRAVESPGRRRTASSPCRSPRRSCSRCCLSPAAVDGRRPRHGALRHDVLHRDPARNVVGEGGGAAHAIWGTLVITGLAAAISVPIGIMAAIYLVEYGKGKRLARYLTFFVDVMTGIPLDRRRPLRLRGLRADLRPRHPPRRDGLGRAHGPDDPDRDPLGRGDAEDRPRPLCARLPTRSVRRSGGRSSRSSCRRLAGMITGVMLAVARIIGETAPLLVTAGVIDSTNMNPFSGRMETRCRSTRTSSTRRPGSAGRLLRPRLGRCAHPDCDRAPAQPDRASLLPAVRDRDPLTCKLRNGKRTVRT